MIWLALASALAQDVLQPGEILVDPPTLITLGVQWRVTGDDDGDATVTVRFREVGAPVWRIGPPLFRVHPEDVVGWTIAPQFAGSIFELLPGRDYELELHAFDPDGLDVTETLTASTRPIPGDPASPGAVAVSDAASLAQALDRAGPGDVITLADGNYAGPFSISANGTAADPIVVRGASRDGVALDGGGCSDCNVLEVYGSYVHVENLTLRNANRALRFQGVGATGNVARRVHAVDVGLGFGAKEDQRDFVLCDNELEGPLAWPHVYADDGGTFANVDGIVVMGSGHVVCHNRLIGWGDAMKMGQDGGRGNDFYGNEVESAYDNGLELDGGEGNVRGFRNRFTNTYATISFQPVRGGPAYAVRNVVVNVANEQLKVHSLGGDEETNGLLIWQNTFVSAGAALSLSDDTTGHHLDVQGNLFVGGGGPKTVDWSGGLDDARFDGDGWYPDGRFDFGAAGDWPDFAAMQANGAFEARGVLLDAPPFASGLQPPGAYTETLPPADVALAAGSLAIDAAPALPGINDAFEGTGPDLGALESGCPAPRYGIRPAGEDESQGLPPCGAGTPTAGTGAPSDTATPAGGTPSGNNAGEAGCGCATGGAGGGSAVALALAALAAHVARVAGGPIRTAARGTRTPRRP